MFSDQTSISPEVAARLRQHIANMPQPQGGNRFSPAQMAMMNNQQPQYPMPPMQMPQQRPSPNGLLGMYNGAQPQGIPEANTQQQGLLSGYGWQPNPYTAAQLAQSFNRPGMNYYPQRNIGGMLGQGSQMYNLQRKPETQKPESNAPTDMDTFRRLMDQYYSNGMLVGSN